MDSILALIIVFWIVSAFSKALNSKKKARQAGKKRVTTWTSGPAKKPSAAPAEPPPAPAPAAEPNFMMPPLEPRPAQTGSLGSTSTEGKDTCDPTLGHDRRRTAAYAGSLGAASNEGKDTCDPALGHDRRSAQARGDEPRIAPGERRESQPQARRHTAAPMEDAYAPDEGLVPELDAQALVQGIVMSEILKRPNERKWGWR